jgi:arylsulfatase A-like enzyme
MRRWSLPRAAGVAAGIAVAVALGCRGGDETPGNEPAGATSPLARSHVLLITVDTLRADTLSFAGYDRPTTPFLDSLLTRGLYFERALAPIARTTASLASTLSGLYPQRHEVRRLWDRLPEAVDWLPELAREAGYRTIAIVSNHILTRERGLDRGFEVYDFGDDGRDARATTAAALAVLHEIDPSEPTFVWIHFIDPHVPYFPAAETARAFDPGYEGPYAQSFGGKPGSIGREAYPADLGKEGAVFRNALPPRVNEHVRRLYAADVRATDDAIRTLLEDIEPPLDEWTLIFASDHGEDLGEHDYHYDHGDYVWNPGLHVPLALVMPGGDPLARAGRVEDWVSLVDVMPTLAELLGVEVPADIDGHSLLPYLSGAAPAARPVFAESGQSFHPGLIRGRVNFGVAGRLRTVIDGRWKLVWTPGQTPEREFALYDLEADPAEQHDIHAPDHPEAARLRELLRGWLRDGAAPSGTPSDADRRALRALGYIED